MKKILLCIALFVASVSSAAAQDGLHITVNPTGQGCYGPAEVEAEQGIRIHSELMVIALNCQHMTPPGWKNFYQQYQEITARNGGLIAGWESTLIRYYGRKGRPDAERAFHDLRTTFANKVSTDAAQMRPDIFCSKFAPRLPKVDQMSQADFQRWAATVPPGQRLTEPLCQ